MIRHFSGLLLLVPILGGCQAIQTIGVVPLAGVVAEARCGPVAVDVANRRGHVEVRADPSVDQPVIVATTKGPDGRLQAASWAAAELVRDEPYPVLRVMAEGDGRPTDIQIRVPAIVGIRVRNAGGPVIIAGAGGAVDVQNGVGLERGGDTTITLVSALEAPFMARTATGALTVTVPRMSRGHVHATSGVGSVAVIAPRREVISGAKATASDWSGTLNGGTNDVRLIAEHGPVTFRITRW
ncbi:MAG: hypothetical protein HBSAPP03_27610 [Phycisphaerae bacterium]|nr:MAG: hypothetical protein HBSAPP03_27610 [Phycisphaerae bacterium]